MDFAKVLRSLEEFLYELVGWLVFYPRTLWRVLRNPGAIAVYTARELEQPPEQQFTETISPVLMLILSVVIAHGIEMGGGSLLPLPDSASPLARFLFGTPQGVVVTRSVFYSAFALAAALVTLRRQRKPVDRATLRPPFSTECFLVAPYAVLFSSGVALMNMSGPVAISGALLMAVAVIWYLWARTMAGVHTSGGSIAGNFLRALAVYAGVWAVVLAFSRLVLAL